MAREYCQQMKQAAPARSELIVVQFQSKTVKIIEGFLATEQGIAGIRHGLGKYTSSRASFDGLMILSALRLRDAIIAFTGCRRGIRE